MTQVLILGAGYAGMRTAKILAKKAPSDINITLIDKETYHTEKTNLHEVAAGTISPDRISYDIREVLPERINFLNAEVVKIDVEHKCVYLKGQDNPLEYDQVVICLGFKSESFGIDGVEQYSLPLDTLNAAKNVWNNIEQSVKRFNETKDERDLNIIICGAGFTGIEVLGELANKIPELQQRYQTPSIRVTCLEKATSILPMFSKELGDYTLNFMSKHNINMVLGAEINSVSDRKVSYKFNDEEKELEASTIVWTVGVSGSDIMEDSNLPAKRGRVIVDDYLNLEGHPEVYVLGDVSAVMDPTSNRPYPVTAQIALSQATYVAKRISKTLDNKDFDEKYEYHSLGTVASLGDRDAVAETSLAGKTIKLKGYPASALKKVITDKSLYKDANISTMLKKGRYDLWK